MAESQGASADSKPRGAVLTAPPLQAHHVASVRVADPEICPIEKTVFQDSTSADVDVPDAAPLVTVPDHTKAAALEENQVVNEVQDSKDVDQIMMEREDEVAQNVMDGVTLRNEDLNREELPGHENSRASLSELFPPLDVGDAKYRSLLEDLQKRNKDLEEAGKHKDEEIRVLNQQVRIQAGVIMGFTCTH